VKRTEEIKYTSYPCCETTDNQDSNFDQNAGMQDDDQFGVSNVYNDGYH
jgi:hypothetical protein